MYSNTDVTLYTYTGVNAYKRSIIKSCYFEKSEQANITKSGFANVNSVLICIPYTNSLKFTKGKDLILKGACDDEITDLKEFRQDHDVYVVMTADDYTAGSQDMWHWELGCK